MRKLVKKSKNIPGGLILSLLFSCGPQSRQSAHFQMVKTVALLGMPFIMKEKLTTAGFASSVVAKKPMDFKIHLFAVQSVHITDECSKCALALLN